ncbi:MAG: hypothetical protein ACLQVW_15695 [Limisphaerales bacterium]
MLRTAVPVGQNPAARGKPARGLPFRRRQAKVSIRHDPVGRPYGSFRGQIDHLATLTADVPRLTEPTSAQRQAFDLIGAPIPLTLTWPEHHPARTGKIPAHTKNCLSGQP